MRLPPKPLLLVRLLLLTCKALAVLNIPEPHTTCGHLARRLLGYQRVGLTKASTAEDVTKAMESAFESVRAALPAVTAPSIVDIGCGIGIYHALISAHYSGKSQHFLVDRSANQIDAPETREHRHFAAHGGYHKSAKSVAFYSSEHCARTIAFDNGLDSTRWHWVNATEANVRALGTASTDVVMSLLSWGFHYPVATYAAAARAILRPRTGRLVMTLRANSGGDKTLEQEYGFKCARSVDGRELAASPQWYTVSCSVDT